MNHLLLRSVTDVGRSVDSLPCREVIYKQAQWQVSSLLPLHMPFPSHSPFPLHSPVAHLPRYLQDGSTEHNVKPDGGGVNKTAKEKAKPAAEQAAASV